MIEAFWKISFINQPDASPGVLVLENGLIRGGDSNYYYVGTYKVEDDIIYADVSVIHYFGFLNNIFGTLEKVEVKVSGKIDHDNFILSGEAVELGQAVDVSVERIGEINP